MSPLGLLYFCSIVLKYPQSIYLCIGRLRSVNILLHLRISKSLFLPIFLKLSTLETAFISIASLLSVTASKNSAFGLFSAINLCCSSIFSYCLAASINASEKVCGIRNPPPFFSISNSSNRLMIFSRNTTS